MFKLKSSFDDRDFQRALKQYLDLRGNVDPQKELRRRAKNIGMRLIAIYKIWTPSRELIRNKVRALGKRVKIREAIRKKGGQLPGMIRAEIRARQNAISFTATGWFPAVTKLGGRPRKKKNLRGPMRGSMEERQGSRAHVTLVNEQPGAAQVAKHAGAAMQHAIDAERDDMLIYIERKIDQNVRRSGL